MLSPFLLANNTIKKKYLVFLKSVLNKSIKKIQMKNNNIYIKVISKNLYQLLLFVKKNTVSQFKTLVDIICYDCPGKNYRFSIIYTILSINLNYRVIVETKLTDKLPVISTIISLYPGAGWLEREVWDMFGVFFLKNPDLRRILTDYGFKGYPLRKDFPLSGFVEVVYDDTQKQVVYKKLDLAQDFRNFKFKNTWKEFI